MTLRVTFMGTPEFSVPALSEIVTAGHDVAAVYTQPARPAGRGMAVRKSPIQEFAEAAGLPVRTPSGLKTEAEWQAFAALRANVAVVIAYGLILPKPILEAPPLGCLNLHASALPRWRGAAPIQRAIMAGDTHTAAMVMQMNEGLDTGPILLAEHMAIGADETAGELHDRLGQAGASLVVRTLAALERGAIDATPQAADGITYARKIDKEEARINFTRPAHEVHNHIRGLSPFPGAFLELRGERIKVLRSVVTDAAGAPGEVLNGGLTIACGKSAVTLLEVQRAGKRPVTAEEFLRGFALPAGSQAGPVDTGWRINHRNR